MFGGKYTASGAVWLAVIGLLAAGGPAPSAAAEKREPKPITAKLTPKLHQLLTDEMRAIREAMARILDGLGNGATGLVERTAEQIFDSFVMRQGLTDKDRKDLEKAVPTEFLDLDHEFHVTAMKLSIASVNRDRDLQYFYFGKLVAACATCHSQYVSDKFPAFTHRQPPGAPAGGHSH